MNLGEIFRKSSKPKAAEELIDFYFHRRLAVLVVKLALQAGLTPNQLTAISLAMGLSSALLFYSDSFLSGSFALLTAIVFDCADGMLARATNETSSIGRIMDGISDTAWVFFIWLGIFSSDYFPYDRTNLFWFVAPSGLSMILHCGTYERIKSNYLSLCHTPEKEPTRQEAVEQLKKGIRGNSPWYAFGHLLFFLHRTLFGWPKSVPLQLSEGQKEKNRDQLVVPMRIWSFLGEGTHLALMTFAGFATPFYPNAMLIAFGIILGPLNIVWIIASLLWRKKLTSPSET